MFHGLFYIFSCILCIIFQTFLIRFFYIILKTNDCHEFYFAIRIVRRALAHLIRNASKSATVGWRRKLCQADFRPFIAHLQSSLVHGLFGLVVLVKLLGIVLLAIEIKVSVKKTRWLYCVEWTQYSTRLEALGYLCDCLCGRPKITSGESNLTLGASPL